MGIASLRSYLRIINGNRLPTFPLTRDYNIASEDIFGTNLGSLKGKKIRISYPVLMETRIEIPPNIK